MSQLDHLRLFDTHELWWVIDPLGKALPPAKQPKLADICFKADLRNIQLQAIGIRGLLPGLTLYMNEENAKRDAELRLQERDTK